MIKEQDKSQVSILDKSIKFYVYLSLIISPLGIWQLTKGVHKILIFLSHHIKIV